MWTIGKSFNIVVFLTFLFWVSMSQEIAHSKVNNEGQERQYYALLISVAQYVHGWPDLSQKIDKLDALSAELQKRNYQVTRVVNPDSMSLLRVINKFIDDHTGNNNTLLVFYAGHCYPDKQGSSFLIPADSQLPSAIDGLSGNEPISIISLLDSFKKRAHRLLFAVDGSISINDSIMIPLKKTTETSSTEGKELFSHVVIGAGSVDEAVPTDSHFIKVFINALQRLPVGKDGGIELKKFYDYVQGEGRRNSLQAPWCKINNNGLTDIVLFERRSEQNNKKKKSWLQVNPIPDFAAIRILNIKPKYTVGGMALSPGRYHIEVIAQGYKKKSQWIRLLPGEKVEFSILLKNQNTTPQTARVSPRETGIDYIDDILPGGKFGYELIKVEKGSFVMGGARYNEGPVHTYHIEKGFFIMDTEVSFKQYSAFLRATGRSNLFISAVSDEKLPVVNVSWQEAVKFAQWLSEVTGHTYRLPTEAEWEYVAKKGISTGPEIKNPGKNNEKVLPVRKAWHSTLGTYGMPGNVWEWCYDCWNQRYKKSKIIAECANRVIRGGSWVDSCKLISATSRNGVASATQANNIGFRLVMQE